MPCRFVSAAFLIVAVATCSACGRAEPPPDSPGVSSAGANARPPDSESLNLDASRDWKPCAAMPADVAGKAIGVSASQLEAFEFGQICMQERMGDSESTEAYAQLGAFNVFGTAKRARARFEASTVDTSPGDMKKINDEIRGKANERLEDEANAQAKQDAAGQIIEALSGGVSYQPVDSVGDAAAMNVENGQLHVLAGNVYFYVLAWSGPTIGDRSAPTTEGIEEARRKHLSKNWDEQKQLQIELASSIIHHLGSQRP